MLKQFSIAVVLSLFFFAPASYAKSKSILAGKKPVKVAILAIATYNAVTSGEGIGELESIGQVAEAGSDDKSLAEAIDFPAFSDFVMKRYKEELSKVKKWEVVSASEIGNQEAIDSFRKNLAEAIKKIPGSDSKVFGLNPDRWSSAANLPVVPLGSALCKLCGNYQKALVEAVAKYCNDAGVDGAWVMTIFAGYGTKGISKFFSKVTMGSGSGTAIVHPLYLLVDKDGNLAFKSKNNEKYRSEESFGMIGGKKKLDKEMEKYILDAINVSAEDVAKRVKKKI